jgi:hypothetical protein
MLASRYISSSMYQKFLEGPSKSFFRSFFPGTKLGQALQVMSMSKAVPEGLKNQECKKGNGKKRPPIPYVPVVDEVQEAIAKGKDFSYKIKLPNRPSLVYPSGTLGPTRPFSFMCSKPKAHVRERGCFRTTMTPLRQKRSPWNKPRASERPSQMQ